MDRYLYKAKRLDTHDWILGFLSMHKTGKYFIRPIGGSASSSEEVEKNTICQCTGLKDKNGKLIWENDIVGYYNKYGKKWCYGLVGYGEFNCSCCSGVYGWHFGDEDIREYKGYEVKGNKFDNPELLEVGE